MSKQFKLCVLHIGTEKTGSTSIQAFLRQNRAALERDGFFYTDTSIGSQWEFVTLVHPHPWRTDLGRIFNISDEQSKQQFCEMFLANFRKQISQSRKASTLLISSEHFHSRLVTPSMIEDLKSTLDPFVEDFRILVYFRRQDELAVGQFNTKIKGGFRGTQIPPRDQTYYDYDALVSRWASVFGLDAIKAGLYRPLAQLENGLLTDFCRNAGINFDNKVIPLWKNQSLSGSGLRFIQVLKQIYKDQTIVMSESDFRDLAELSTRHNAGRFQALSKSEARSFYAKFSEGNRAVRDKLFPDYPASLFDEDFSNYSTEAEALPVSYEEAVIQMLKLWKLSQFPFKKRSLIQKLKIFLKTGRW